MNCYDATLKSQNKFNSPNCVYPYCNSKYYSAYGIDPFKHSKIVSENYRASQYDSAPYYATRGTWNNSAISMTEPDNLLSYQAVRKY